MSTLNEGKIINSFSSVISFIKDEVRKNLVEANNSNIIKIDKIELEKTVNLIDSFIANAYIKSSSEVINAIKNKK